MVRTHSSARPIDLLDVDRAAMLPLPPIAADGRVHHIGSGWPRDYYVRVLDTNDYSVDPTMIGRIVDVNADLQTVSGSGSGT